jgi:hypothetical protein
VTVESQQSPYGPCEVRPYQNHVMMNANPQALRHVNLATLNSQSARANLATCVLCVGGYFVACQADSSPSGFQVCPTRRPDTNTVCIRPVREGLFSVVKGPFKGMSWHRHLVCPHAITDPSPEGRSRTNHGAQRPEAEG